MLLTESVESVLILEIGSLRSFFGFLIFALSLVRLVTGCFLLSLAAIFLIKLIELILLREISR